MAEAYVYTAVRTPFGRFGGALSGTRPDDLAADVLGKFDGLDPALIDDLVWGNATGAPEDDRNLGSMAFLLAKRWGVAAFWIGLERVLAVVLENVRRVTIQVVD